MFIVSEVEAAAIRTAFDRGGELSAAVELRRLFPGVTDNGGGTGMRSGHRWLEAAGAATPKAASGPEVIVGGPPATGTTGGPDWPSG